MAIYEIFEGEKKDASDDALLQGELFEHMEGFEEEKSPSLKDRFLSTFFARLFFFLLLVLDVVWGVYAAAFCIIFNLASLVSLRRNAMLRSLSAHYVLSVKRASVCALSLLVALFAPALGVMFACTYFLMYDKKGIDEIVPGILRTQFKEFFSPVK